MIFTFKKLLSDDLCLFTVGLLSFTHTAPVALHQLVSQSFKHFKLFEQYLIQDKAKTPFDQNKKLFRKVWIDTFLNHFVKIPLSLFLSYPLLSKFLNLDRSTAFEMPLLKLLSYQIIIAALLEDALFYWSHRALHHPYLFKTIHSKHHKFHNLTAYPIASEYTHPIESLVGNILPVLAGPLVLGMNLASTQIWLWIRMLKTCDAHCGYDLPFSPFGWYPLNSARRHDFHHEKGVGSFGSFFVLWDQFCGTDEAYERFQEKKRKNKKP
ncbi:hypothetical protein TrLO_g14362 [Triparma laevis f. longispina]|uniref:Fatty acid hydroxylase domain-containing protein n=1 Tax=Triparma laevis f. longispina TaxID=1714387 RepID=A0A9W7L152_9STRA|nr:hypothetical protein TrLO_g14362 [Triparma laevis f. longispina]